MRWMVAAALGAMIVTVAAATHAEPADDGAVVYSSPESTEALQPAQRTALSYLWRRQCRVGSLSQVERESVQAARGHVLRALSDPAVQRLVGRKGDWVVETADGWRRRPGDGLEALRLLVSAGSPLHVGVFSYGQTEGNPCRTPLADGATNAYTMLGASAILLFRPYLSEASAAVRAGHPEGLARTLVHETLHVLGYTHPDGPLEIGGVVYNNTVPVYLACVVEAWPDLQAAARVCGRARDEPDPAY